MLLKNVTLQHLLNAFACEINLLQAGKNADGSPEDGNYKFAYAGSKGDLEWHWQAYILQRYYRCNLLCSRCWASKVDPLLLWTNLKEDAGWRHTVVSTEAFLANARHHGELPSLCNMEGWAAETMHWDLMHNLFIGCGRDSCGSVLMLLCLHKYFDNSNGVDLHLKLCHASVLDWYAPSD